MDYPYEYAHALDRYINWGAARNVTSMKAGNSVVDKYPSVMRVLAQEQCYHTLIISGGEPLTRSIKSVMRFARAAKRYFSRVLLETAANEDIIEHELMKTIPVDGIIYQYSNTVRPIPNVEHLSCPVFCHVSVGTLEGAKIIFMDMPQVLKRKGYAGMVVYEKYPDGPALKKLLQSYANFQVIYRTPDQEFKYSVLTVDKQIIWESEVKYDNG
jgi:hypothetical protein